MTADRTLLLMGGDEDPDEDHMRLLPRLVDLAGGASARVLICGAPTGEPEEKFSAYRPLFERIGAAEILAVPLRTREEAGSEAALSAIESSTAIFFPGGDQLRIATLLAGTAFEDRMRQRFREGHLVIAGTSAGAAVVSQTIVVGGADGGYPSLHHVQMAPGLGYWKGVIIEPHFSARGRIGRLVSALAQNPALLALGIDADTAIEVSAGECFRVIGEGAVTVLDGRGIDHDTVAQARPDEPIAVTKLTMHVLADGWSFDLADRIPRPPEEEGQRNEGNEGN